MKKNILITVSLVIINLIAMAQDLHFSQFYNAPLLLNVANTGMVQDNDWRAGIQYRNQGATIPLPYNTFSAFSDFGIGKAKWENSWLGGGVAMWRDVAGQGSLSLTKVQGNVAYHVLMSENSSFSLGMGLAYSQRSVDFSKLTFDVQWDEFTFDKNIPNQEANKVSKTNFLDASTGANFAYYNNSDLYVKIGLGVSHINRPIETFYGESNRLGIRPIANIDVVYKANNTFIINPSIYYTRQKKASELVVGSLVNINTSGEKLSLASNEVILGTFYRNNDAIVGVVGYKFKNSKFMVNYDHTISSLSAGNGGVGAMEFSLIIQGNYRNDGESTKAYGCPRF